MKDHRKERSRSKKKSRKTGITDDASGEGLPS